MTARLPRPNRLHFAETGDQRFDGSGWDRAGPLDTGYGAPGNFAHVMSHSVPVRVDSVVDQLDGEQRWKALARARLDGSPRLIAAAEDGVFRCYLALAVATANDYGELDSDELDAIAELGLAQAVLAWRRPDAIGFMEFARRYINYRLRAATAQGRTTENPVTLGRMPVGAPEAAAGAFGRVRRRQSVEVAMLDRTGVIVSVNDAWRDFSAANGGNSSRTGVGMSYLAVCDAAGDDVHAHAVAAAIREAASGDLPAPVTIVVPCHSPQVQRWYDVLVSPRLNRKFRTVGVAVTLSLRAGAR